MRAAPRLFSVHLALLTLCLGGLLVSPVMAASEFDAKIALHVKSAPAKGVSACGDYQPSIPCSDYSVQGDLGTIQYVYLVVAQVDSAGVAGVSCGVDYDGVNGQGVDVYQWILCSGGLEFPNSGQYGPWPAAGGGNRMTFDDCQNTEIGSDGVHAVLGAFITYAYGPDVLSITENRNLNSGPELVYVVCSGLVERSIHGLFPEVAFSAGEVDPGHNPCLDGPVGCVSAANTTFETVTVGEYEDRELTVTNVFDSDHLTGEAFVDGEGFEIVSGGGPYDLAPGESRVITIRFSPTAPGTYYCTVDPGTPCRPVSLKGVGVGCSVPYRVFFPITAIGSSSDKSILVTNGYNDGGPHLTGTMTTTCPDFHILSGADYDLAPGESQTVMVRFTPTSVGIQECLLEVGSLCNSVRLQGPGGTPSGAVPKVALHAAPVNPSAICNSPVQDLPCSQFETSGSVGSSSFVYLVVGKADPVLGVGGLHAGIDYNPSPGQGVDVIDWYSCAETQIPTAGTGLPATWPAAGGGSIFLWADCQTNINPPDDLHAVAGAFYVYAYSSDEMRVIPAPFGDSSTLAVGTCFGATIHPDPNTDAGSVAFSEGATVPGHNPCMETVEAADAEVSPGSLNLASGGKWITAYVELPQGYDPGTVANESVRLMGTVPADLSFPAFDPADPTDFNENGVPDLTFKFDRGAFIPLIPEDEDSMDVVITGMGDMFQFQASDRIRLVRPRMLSPNGSESFVAGTVQEITWQTPAGWQDVHARLDYSTNDGETWISITDQGRDGSHLWRTPLEVHDAVTVRVRIFDAYGYLGGDISDAPFSLTQTVGVDDRTRLRPGLRQGVPNPFRASTAVAFVLEQDAQTSLDIFNVQGQRIRTLEKGFLTAGEYERSWDGRDDAGNRVASGVYLVHLRSGELQETRRVLLTR